MHDALIEVLDRRDLHAVDSVRTVRVLLLVAEVEFNFGRDLRVIGDAHLQRRRVPKRRNIPEIEFFLHDENIRNDRLNCDRDLEDFSSSKVHRNKVIDRLDLLEANAYLDVLAFVWRDAPLLRDDFAPGERRVVFDGVDSSETRVILNREVPALLLRHGHLLKI